jgi:predicted metal-dependent hydrolase
MEDDLITKFGDGIKKFNSGDFYDCHDVLEDIWFEIRGSSRSFYQGLIHLAVGFYHIFVLENHKGAISQLSKGIAKLKEFEPEFQGVELKHLLDKISICVQEIGKIKSGKKIFNEELIPKIKFDKSKFIFQK